MITSPAPAIAPDPAAHLIHETPRIPFRLPQGLDVNGTLYRDGTMRLATGEDELRGHKAAQMLDNAAYGVLVRLACVTTLAHQPPLTPDDMGELFMPDLTYLIEFYNDINPPDYRLSLLGESQAIPWTVSTRR